MYASTDASYPREAGYIFISRFLPACEPRGALEGVLAAYPSSLRAIQPGSFPVRGECAPLRSESEDNAVIVSTRWWFNALPASRLAEISFGGAIAGFDGVAFASSRDTVAAYHVAIPCATYLARLSPCGDVANRREGWLSQHVIVSCNLCRNYYSSRVSSSDGIPVSFPVMIDS